VHGLSCARSDSVFVFFEFVRLAKIRDDVIGNEILQKENCGTALRFFRRVRFENRIDDIRNESEIIRIFFVADRRDCVAHKTLFTRSIERVARKRSGIRMCLSVFDVFAENEIAQSENAHVGLDDFVADLHVRFFRLFVAYLR
jgi:hypothetical protein